MIELVKFYKAQTQWLVLVGALAFFIVLTAPVLTWVNTDSDGSVYMMAAKYFRNSHPTGAPVYNFLNMALLRINPYGSEAWRLALGSAIAAGFTTWILYRYTGSLIAPLAYMASGLVVSQATIIESYSLITLLMVVMYVYRDNQKVVIVAGLLGLGIHHLIGLTLIPVVFWYWQTSRPLKPFLWLFLAPLWYIYIPLANRPPYELWLRGEGLIEYVNYFAAQGGLTLGLAVISNDAIIRAQDVAVIVFAGFNLIMVPIALRWRNDLLTWVAVLPLLHYALGLPHVAYVYAMPAFAFGAIMAAEGFPKIEEIIKSSDVKYFPRYLAYGVLGFLVAFNIVAYDIGDALDADSSAVDFYDQLRDIPPDSAVWTYFRGWELVTMRLYNADNGADLDFIIKANYEIDDAKCVIGQATANRRLYRTQNIDPTKYLVRIERSNPWEIWPDVAKQFYGVDRIPSEHTDFNWADVGVSCDRVGLDTPVLQYRYGGGGAGPMDPDDD